MATATSSRRRSWVFAAAAMAAAAVLGRRGRVPVISLGDRPREREVNDGGGLAGARRSRRSRRQPAGIRRACPGGGAVLAYPPAMRPVSGDRGTVSAAQVSSSGKYLMYLNATPKQGAETLRDWPEFRLEHLTDDDASTARQLAASHGVRFLGGTGTCVIDAYVTKIKAHHFTELACFVQGRTSSSVIIAAAPTASWATASGVLMRAVAAYQVR